MLTSFYSHFLKRQEGSRGQADFDGSMSPLLRKIMEPTANERSPKIDPAIRAALVQQLTQADQVVRIKVRASLPLNANTQSQLVQLGCENEPYMTVGSTAILAATLQTEDQLAQLLALDCVRQIQIMPTYTLA